MPVYNELPKITSGTDTTDATAIADDIRIDKTAYVNGEKVTGTIQNLPTQYMSIIPSTESVIIEPGYYLADGMSIIGSHNLLPKNIKLGVDIFGVTGTYSGGGSINRGILLNTSEFTSAQDTLTAYGNTTFIYESSAPDSFLSLNDIVTKWGGLESQNNYIGPASSKYGIYMSNWTEQQTNNALLFITPIEIISGELIFKFNCNCSSWMNPSINIHFVNAIGNTQEEILDSILNKMILEDYVLTYTFVHPGNLSQQNILVMIENVPAGTYYVLLDGTVKSDNSSFTYINIAWINF